MAGVVLFFYLQANDNAVSALQCGVGLGDEGIELRCDAKPLKKRGLRIGYIFREGALLELWLGWCLEEALEGTPEAAPNAARFHSRHL